KINLQNAADVAAYAGAATQARQLDAIGALNYDLRRNYKRFLYRYISFGNINRPDRRSGSQYSFEAQRSSQVNNFVNLGVPAVCLVFKPNDNYCRIYNLESIQVSGRPNFLDAIGAALGQVLDNLEQIRRKNCGALTVSNILALTLWLYNTDPEGIQNLINTVYSDAESRLALQTVANVSQGLGVIPRNKITLQRIMTLQNEFLNHPAEENVDNGRAEAMESSLNPMIFERTVLAYKSARRTLGVATFGESFTMDEILPDQPLDLETIAPEFYAYATYMGVKDGSDPDCTQRLYGLQVPQGMLPVAVYKKGPPIFYGVRLRGEPTLLFKLFNLPMEAYSAAKPFGSRLGPATTEAEFVSSGTPLVGIGGGYSGRVIPNLILDPNNRTSFLDHGIFTGIRSYIQGGGQAELTERFLRAEGASSLPNKQEYGRYIIPTDYTDPSIDDSWEPFKTHFVAGTTYPIYAPISLAADSGRSAIEGIVNQIPNTPQFQNLRTSLTRNLATYFTKLATNQGELGEGIQVARLMNPELDFSGQSATGLIRALPTITGAELRPWFSGYGLGPQRPRIGKPGYSVKFVSFKSLANERSLPRSSQHQGVINVIDH
ncbi:hypothetical protein EBZ37_03300, partial [bacterium]|nr:hypothetical protein [bacterium]